MRPIMIERVGADPEVFCVDKDGKPFSAEGLFGGSKHHPKPMGIGDGFFIQEDNAAAEYNIPPCDNANSFAQSLINGLNYIHKVAADNNLKVVLKSALHFSKEQLATVHCQTLGCEPDFNVWLQRVNDRPTPPDTLRTAAGHVHISWEKATNDQRDAVVKMCDVHMALPSLLVSEKNERRQLYGKAGCFRPKSYGAEYRTLDNFWIGTPAYAKHIFNTTRTIAQHLDIENDCLLEELDSDAERIQHAINEFDKDVALRLMEKYNVMPFPSV